LYKTEENPTTETPLGIAGQFWRLNGTFRGSANDLTGTYLNVVRLRLPFVSSDLRGFLLQPRRRRLVLPRAPDLEFISSRTSVQILLFHNHLRFYHYPLPHKTFAVFVTCLSSDITGFYSVCHLAYTSTTLPVVTSAAY